MWLGKEGQQGCRGTFYVAGRGVEGRPMWLDEVAGASYVAGQGGRGVLCSWTGGRGTFYDAREGGTGGATAAGAGQRVRQPHKFPPSSSLLWPRVCMASREALKTGG